MPGKVRRTEKEETEETEEKENCCICIDEVKNRGKISCDHKFCFECIANWSKVTNSCPICKKTFKKITPVLSSAEKKREKEKKGEKIKLGERGEKRKATATLQVTIIIRYY